MHTPSGAREFGKTSPAARDTRADPFSDKERRENTGAGSCATVSQREERRTKKILVPKTHEISSPSLQGVWTWEMGNGMYEEIGNTF